MNVSKITSAFASLLSVSASQIYVELSPTNSSIVLISVVAPDEGSASSMKQKVAHMPQSEASDMGFSSVTAAPDNTPSPTGNNDDKPKKKIPMAALAGGAAAGVLVLSILAYLIYKRRSNQGTGSGDEGAELNTHRAFEQNHHYRTNADEV